MRIYFYAPAPGREFVGRADSRVRVLDHDPVTLTSRVEFPDGVRLVVADRDLVSREV